MVPYVLQKKGKNSRRAAPDGGNGRLVPDLRTLLKDMAGKGIFIRWRPRGRFHPLRCICPMLLELICLF
ncbi:hypothetical protein DESPIG_00344 [Desulfovibrio piger ATCC 29098]|uniref:Uncharacterized protein n=1 Tax=Desulfovibrio piger ATCC 29098 TaxID=411464 RepID=B6WQM0_9BACT|nr:hypothetical protein DESPIG_00344 [Desulfovibrio piger ATCC 29098]